MGAVADLAVAVPGFDFEQDAPGFDPMTRATARTVRPIGVAARCRTLTIIPTLTWPVGRYRWIANLAAISMCRIIVGVP